MSERIDPFTRLIYLSNLYPAEFVEAYGERSVHWFTSSPMSQERSLCHDMVCVLLCNQQALPPEKRPAPPIRTAPEKRAKRESTSERSDEGDSSESDEDILDLGVGLGQDIPGEGFSGEDPAEANYRFRVLEGLSNIANVQHFWAKRWETATPDSQWDIIDVLLRKFIEVKVTSNIDAAKKEYAVKNQELLGNTSLIVVHPYDGTTT